MIYTPLTKKAMKICVRAHEGQTDKSGLPYLLHPFHVAEQMKDEYSTCAALLHDVVEDTDVTLGQLKDQGIPDQVLEAVGLLTHGENVPYLEYVDNLKHNPIARAVKLADIEHNSDLARLDVIRHYDLERLEKYKKAKAILEAVPD